MIGEGELMLRVGVAAHRIRTIEVTSTRAPLPSRLTHGRGVEDVARTIPRLYSLCARAHAAAAAGALEAASGSAPDPEQRQQREFDVRREAIVELLSRLLIDWPRVLELQPDVAAIARVRQAAPERQLAVCNEVAHRHVFGTEAASWLEAGSADVERWIAAAATLPARCLQGLLRDCADLGRSAVGTMPETNIDELARMLPPLDGSPEFSRRPSWNGIPVETGALARHARDPRVGVLTERCGNGVATRFLAQLVDLATALAGHLTRADVQQVSPVAGVGIGVAQTARGLLLHQARVHAGRVLDYRIVAPTEWNFHPDGALKLGLVGRPVRDAGAARRDTALLVQALDPCVACSIEVVDA